MTWESTPAPRYGNRPLAGEFRGVGLGGAISAFSAWRRGELAEGLREQLGECGLALPALGDVFLVPLCAEVLLEEIGGLPEAGWVDGIHGFLRVAR